jgi:hypothetical protein
MTYLSIVLIAIVALFAMFIVVRSVFSINVCALCASVSTTWIVLLVLLYTGSAIDPLLIGILMGGSIVGVMYLLEEKLPEAYALFKLPFYVTLVVSVYVLLAERVSYLTLVILGVVWMFTLVLFVKKDAEHIKALGNKIINCCKNW